jgi:LuxR family maltose regulon positive regulatory protein
MDGRLVSRIQTERLHMHIQINNEFAAVPPGVTATEQRGYGTPPSYGHHLINSKLKPPQAASAWVERKELVSRLGKAARKRLVVLTAPIGSGKTTLLSQWYRHAPASHCLAWLSLDEQDNEPARFFSYLSGAVRSAVVDFDACAANGFASGVSSLDPIAAAFAESFGRIDQELVIVLDDFQWIIDPALTRAFAFLVQRAPPNIHWIVSGRCMPDLDLSRFRLQDQLVVIDSADLNFDTAHIVQLSRKLSRHALSVVNAECIRERTEGWVAGAKLALLAASDPANATESLTQFAGSHCEVARYLATAVLQEQLPEVREFLVASSIVDRMNGDLCNTLLGISNGQALLENLEASQLFIQPLDSHRQWYRYHTLFRDFLRTCLRRDASGRMPALHQLASHWFAEHQMVAEALHHAFEAADRQWCIDLISRYARAWLKSGEISELLRWSARLSRAEILSRHDIYSAYITSLILSRRFTEAAADLHEAEQLFVEAGNRSESISAQLQALRLMLSILADSGGDIDLSELDLTELGSGRNGADAFLAGMLMTLQAYWLLRRNQFDVARRCALRARDVLRDIDCVYGVGYAEVVACLADRAQGNMKAAADNCERVFAAVRNGRRNPAWANAATALAHVRYEQNRLAEAEALCVDVLPLLSVASTVENFTIAYLTLARLKIIAGRHAEAFPLLDYLHSMLEAGSQRRFLSQVCYEKIRLCLMTNNAERARMVAADFGLPEKVAQHEWLHAREYDEAWERLGFAHAALLLHEWRYEECRNVLSVLRDSAHKAGYVYREISLEGALSACEWQAGEVANAFAALNRGFALTRRSGFSRGVLDEAPVLQEVLASAVRSGKLLCLLPVNYFTRFRNIFAADRDCMPQADTKRKPALPLEPLTDREIDMLRLLSQGLSNMQISERSQIALSTAKWHLKNVFAKLDVGTRTGAIARARGLQLIE